MVKAEKTTKQRAWLPRLCWILTGVTLAVLLALWGLLLSTRMVPTLYLVLLLAVAVLIADVVFILTRDGACRGRTIGGCVLTAAAVLGSAGGGFYLWHTVSVMRTVSDAVVERSQVSFYAMKNSAAETLGDLADGTFGVLKELDRSNTDETLQQVESEHGLTLAVSEYDSLIQMADALRGGTVDAIVLNEAYLTLYEETPGYEEFPAQIKAISTRQVEHVIEAEPSEPANADPVFNILISGSDTRDEYIDQRGRSDVNIIASINTETHQILLISTPRDYFVPLDVGVDNAYDKLTHAGIYGVDVLMGTLENLYGIDIDYYFRINFTGFVEVIDALGGVEVYSAYDFTAGDHHYVQGMNTLNGEEALTFARERHAFSEGDRQRGSNQLEVVKAVFQKAISPAILTQYLSILNSVRNCVDTSIPYDVIADLVRRQLESGAAWSIESFSANGSDSRSATYSMNQNLYVMIPDEETVQQAKQKLEALGNVMEQDETQTGAAEQADGSAESESEPAA